MSFKSPMLASDYKPELLKFPVIASAKIDGIRAVIDRGYGPHSEQNLFDPYARSGKIIRNKYIQQQIGLTSLRNVDGELVVGEHNAPDVYNRTSSGVMAEKGEPDFTYWVFDMRNMDNTTFTLRHQFLCLVVEGVGNPRVKVLPQQFLLDMEALEVFEAECLAAGFEGIMVRDPNALYKYGRSTAKGGELLKVKRVSHDEAEIIGFEEQMTNLNEATTNELGRTKRSSAKDGLAPADTLGAFICRNESLWPGQTFNISPGVLTHAERKELWDKRDSFIGETITFKHLAHGAKDKPRHGRFNGFRDPIDLS